MFGHNVKRGRVNQFELRKCFWRRGNEEGTAKPKSDRWVYGGR